MARCNIGGCETELIRGVCPCPCHRKRRSGGGGK